MFGVPHRGGRFQDPVLWSRPTDFLLRMFWFFGWMGGWVTRNQNIVRIFKSVGNNGHSLSTVSYFFECTLLGICLDQTPERFRNVQSLGAKFVMSCLSVHIALPRHGKIMEIWKIAKSFSRPVKNHGRGNMVKSWNFILFFSWRRASQFFVPRLNEVEGGGLLNYPSSVFPSVRLE